MTSKIQQVISNRRKQPYEIERENYEKEMAMHIGKAISKEEGATKEKHVRTILMGTFKDSSSRLFWSIASRLQLQGHPIVCWKFLHVLHKLLREGHHSCLVEAVSYRTLLSELAKLWGHLKEGYGKPIQSFSRLIIAKLKFHNKYPDLPGTISLTSVRVANITQNAIDSYFELSVDLLDYLDEVLVFQLAVFSSLDKSKANSMTAHGQCKLSPLIQCLQDSAALYDALVNILYRLHSQLPSDTLTGHTERFIKSFKELQTFYETCSNLQYYKNLVSVPQLPEQAPNFLLSGGLSQHTAPVVSTVSPVEEEVEDDYDDKENPANWVPELATMRAPVSPPSGPPLLDFTDESPVSKQEAHFDSSELFTASFPPPQVNGVSTAKIHELTAKIQELERRIDQLLKDKQELEKKVGLVGQQAKELEELRAYQQKFVKMKEIYQKLREEHIALLRNHSASNKEVNDLKQQIEISQKSLTEQKNQLAHLNDLRNIQSNNNTSDSPVEIQAELLDARRRKDELEAALATADAERAALNLRASEAQSAADSLKQESFSLAENLRIAEEKVQSQEEQLQSLTKRIETDNLELKQSANQQLADTRRQLITRACAAGVSQIQGTLDVFDDPSLISCRSNADFLLGRVDALLSEVENVEESCQNYLSDPEAVHEVLSHIHAFVARTQETILQGRIVSDAAPTLDVTEGSGGNLTALHDNINKVITRIGCHDNVYSNTLEDTVKLEYKARLARPCKHRTYTVAKSDSKWPDEDDIVNFMNAFIIPQLEFGQEFNSSADPHYHHILGNMSSNDISNTAESAVLRSLINQDCDKAKINETIRDFWCSSVQRISKNLIYLWVKPESIVANSYREEITYKWPEVLSEIGGTLGLWLGMSLLTFFELFELFFLCYFRDPNKQRNKQEESKNSAELEKFTVDNL